MRLGGDQLSDGVGEGRVRVDIEDRNRVFALLHTAFVQDDRDEVQTGVLQQWQARSVGQKSNIYRRDVTNDIRAVIDYSDARQTLGIHKAESFGQWALGTAYDG